MSLRVAVIGMGPVGQILAVFLNSGGCTVGIYDKDNTKQRMIADEGILLSGLYNEKASFRNIIRNPEELKMFDPELIIIAVKIYHTPAVVEELKVAGLQSRRIICAQNGIDSEAAVIEGAGEENVYRMVVNFAGNLREPNCTHVTFFNPPNYLASIDDSGGEFSQYFSELLTETGLETMNVNSFWLQNRVWEKTILNAALSALCGITGLTMKEAMSRPDLVAIVERLIDESVEVAKEEEIFFGENFSKICLRYLRNAGDHHPSLAVDMQNNRRTEIDYFNGQFVRYGMKHYVRTPLHFVFTNLVKAHTNE